jgi:hypothetical protein
VEEAFLRQEVEAAGFRLVEEGTFLRNPNDPREPRHVRLVGARGSEALHHVRPRRSVNHRIAAGTPFPSPLPPA